MARDYWVYQERRDVKEPWAAHVHIIGTVSVDIRFYAEYLPASCSNYLDVSCDYASILDAFRAFSEEHGQEFTIDEVQQVQRLWLKIAKDAGIVI